MKKWAGGHMDKIGTSIDNWHKETFENNSSDYLKYIQIFKEEQIQIKLGGGTITIEKQHNKKRLTARERIDHLIDSGSIFFPILVKY